ncbi:hypothetical protein H9623_18040 [Oerskovia sp. Sa1BUA8]|uniref:Uncharacterized protein n=1 Tax=Oerskovia douganii TaxID=2762210 RepID=A0A9D5UC36_9CELL|nr:hypothetical protein [Oerskovia douganii]MBE7702195.1 hypothetical protein [Oerskovia douganii]
MPMTSRREPAVLVAGLVTSIVWVGTAVLSDWAHTNVTDQVDASLVRALVPHPNGTLPGGAAITGQTILAALLAGLVVMAVAYLATRRLPRRSGGWAVFLAAWSGVVVGGVVGSVADTVADIAFPAPMNPAFHLLASSFDGGWWGLVNGWVVALSLAGTLAVTNRSSAADLPATRRSRKPLRARAYPAVIVAGLTATVVWVAVGAAGSWLVWHRSARGPIDLVGEIAPGAMIFRFAPQAQPVQVTEVVLAVVVGLVVAGGAWLATRRLPPGADRWTATLAVWHTTVVAAVLAGTARSFATYAPSGLHPATVDLVLPAAQASLVWPLATGWVAALLAGLTYERTGGGASAEVVPPTDSTGPEGRPDVEDPPRSASDDAPRSALHTDTEEPSLVP